MTTKLKKKLIRETDVRYQDKIIIVTLDPELSSVSLRQKATSKKTERSIPLDKLYAMLNLDKTQDDEIRELIRQLD